MLHKMLIAIACAGIVFSTLEVEGQNQTVKNNNNGITNAVPSYCGLACLSAGGPIYQSGTSVGIGTSSPSATLDVNNFGGGANFNTGHVTMFIGDSTGNGLSLFNSMSTGYATHIMVDGLNPATSPNAKALQILNASGSPLLTLQNNGFAAFNGPVLIPTSSSTGFGLFNSNANVWTTHFYVDGLDPGPNPSAKALLITNASGAWLTTILNNGNFGIGATAPSAKLEVNGSIKLTAGSGASITFQDGTVQSSAYTGVTCGGGDFAESVDVTGKRNSYEPGDVMVIDPNAPGKFVKSSKPYSTSVMGIFSTRPGTVGRRQLTPKSPDEVPMAMVGIVPTKVSAENGPIHAGDLLVTSSVPGYAMKGTDRNRMLGAVIGKALGSLDRGTGIIEAGVTLQ